MWLDNVELPEGIRAFLELVPKDRMPSVHRIVTRDSAYGNYLGSACYQIWIDRGRAVYIIGHELGEWQRVISGLVYSRASFLDSLDAERP